MGPGTLARRGASEPPPDRGRLSWSARRRTRGRCQPSLGAPCCVAAHLPVRSCRTRRVSRAIYRVWQRYSREAQPGFFPGSTWPTSLAPQIWAMLVRLSPDRTTYRRSRPGASGQGLSEQRVPVEAPLRFGDRGGQGRRGRSLGAAVGIGVGLGVAVGVGCRCRLRQSGGGVGGAVATSPRTAPDAIGVAAARSERHPPLATTNATDAMNASTKTRAASGRHGDGATCRGGDGSDLPSRAVTGRGTGTELDRRSNHARRAAGVDVPRSSRAYTSPCLAERSRDRVVERDAPVGRIGLIRSGTETRRSSSIARRYGRDPRVRGPGHRSPLQG